MSTDVDDPMPTTVADEPQPIETSEHGGDHGHVSDMLFIKLAIFLAVLTAAEVAWPFIVEDGPGRMWPLLIMMVVKFVLIVSYFMHLKFDSPVLSRIFYAGLVLAVGVYVAALAAFRVFWGEY